MEGVGLIHFDLFHDSTCCTRSPQIIKSIEILISVASASFLPPNKWLLLIPLTCLATTLVYLSRSMGSQTQGGDTSRIDLGEHAETRVACCVAVMLKI